MVLFSIMLIFFDMFSRNCSMREWMWMALAPMEKPHCTWQLHMNIWTFFLSFYLLVSVVNLNWILDFFRTQDLFHITGWRCCCESEWNWTLCNQRAGLVVNADHTLILCEIQAPPLINQILTDGLHLLLQHIFIVRKLCKLWLMQASLIPHIFLFLCGWQLSGMNTSSMDVHALLYSLIRYRIAVCIEARLHALFCSWILRVFYWLRP